MKQAHLLVTLAAAALLTTSNLHALTMTFETYSSETVDLPGAGEIAISGFVAPKIAGRPKPSGGDPIETHIEIKYITQDDGSLNPYGGTLTFTSGGDTLWTGELAYATGYRREDESWGAAFVATGGSWSDEYAFGAYSYDVLSDSETYTLHSKIPDTLSTFSAVFATLLLLGVIRRKLH